MKTYKIGRIVLTPVLLIPLACIANSNKEKKSDKQFNIVHIMSDDHSFQTISAYGHPISKLAPTPNIDRLAAKGMLFQKSYVENSLSTPSRACLMTGLYSHQSGQRTLGAGIDTSKVFFTEALKKSGYQTAVVGKWHMQCEPKGFDYYSILGGQGEYYNPGFKTKQSQGKYIKEIGYATTLITDHALEFLDARDKDRPFCVLIHHKAPHRNWMPDSKYLTLYEDIEFPYPATFYDDYSTRCEAAHTQEMRIENHMSLGYDLKVNELIDSGEKKDEWQSREWATMLRRMTNEQRDLWHNAYKVRNEKFIKSNLQGEDLLKWKYQAYLKDYLRCIKSVDDEIGRVLDYLERENLMDNTIIVYTSDQGFYMGEHGWFDKRFMYEESFRTPLIVYYPQNMNAGSTSNTLVQNIDYAPTYLTAAGLDVPKYMVGRPLQSVLSDKTPKNWRQYLYYHYYDYPAIHQVRRHDGVSDGRFKLIHFYDQKSENGDKTLCNEFYDLNNDPNELNNIYGDKKYKKEISRLQKQLDKFRKEQNVDEF
ncbi:sulfatase [Paludibacter sp.]